MKTVIDSLSSKIKNLTSDINRNLRDIEFHNEQIQDLVERNERNRIAVDEATNALSILNPDYFKTEAE